MSQRGSAVIVVAHIAEAIAPVVRGARYEDPLDAALRGAGLGKVNGGGSLLGAQRDVASVDVEMALRDLDGALQFARVTLLSLGAPAGSLLMFLRDGSPRALAVATGEEFDHRSAVDALERRMVFPEIDDEEEEQRRRVEAAARKLLQDFEGLWAGTYEYPPADLSVYSAEWLRWYDHVADALAPQGIEFAGDVASVRTDLPQPRMYGFSRKFLAAGGITRVDAFQVAAAKPRPPVQAIVFKSEFGNGRYLSTSNVVKKWNIPDFIDAEILPTESPAAALAERHAVRLAAYLAANPVVPVHLASLAQLLAAEERERTRTRGFRQAQAVPSRAELERLGAQPGFAALVHDEMRRLRGM